VERRDDDGIFLPKLGLTHLIYPESTIIYYMMRCTYEHNHIYLLEVGTLGLPRLDIERIIAG
jgi:hypothetical protein